MSGSTGSNAVRGPDAMPARVPPFAPAIPPDTGASIHAMPCGSRPRETRPAMPGPLVDKSTTILAREPRATPLSTTCSTISGVGRLTNTMSAELPTSSGEEPVAAPTSLTAFWASALESKTTRWDPEPISRRLMGPPIRPRPINPIVGVRVSALMVRVPRKTCPTCSFGRTLAQLPKGGTARPDITEIPCSAIATTRCAAAVQDWEETDSRDPACLPLGEGYLDHMQTRRGCAGRKRVFQPVLMHRDDPLVLAAHGLEHLGAGEKEIRLTPGSQPYRDQIRVVFVEPCEVVVRVNVISCEDPGVLACARAVVADDYVH